MSQPGLAPAVAHPPTCVTPSIWNRRLASGEAMPSRALPNDLVPVACTLIGTGITKSRQPGSCLPIGKLLDRLPIKKPMMGSGKKQQNETRPPSPLQPCRKRLSIQSCTHHHRLAGHEHERGGVRRLGGLNEHPPPLLVLLPAPALGQRRAGRGLRRQRGCRPQGRRIRPGPVRELQQRPQYCV